MAGGFYDVGALQQLAINLFHGWGYNFYRSENQLRADDQLVRSQAAGLLGTARSDVAAAESAYRRTHFATPSRAQPFPDASVVAAARALEELGSRIGTLHGRMQSQPVPENDRMTQRYREEAGTLRALIELDKLLVGQAALLQNTVHAQDGGWLLEHAALLDEGLAAIQQTLREREALLLMPPA